MSRFLKVQFSYWAMFGLVALAHWLTKLSFEVMLASVALYFVIRHEFYGGHIAVRAARKDKEKHD